MAALTQVFTWSDSETKLLLECIMAFKTELLGRGIMWEGERNKYQEIFRRFLEEIDRRREGKLNLVKKDSGERQKSLYIRTKWAFRIVSMFLSVVKSIYKYSYSISANYCWSN